VSASSRFGPAALLLALVAATASAATDATRAVVKAIEDKDCVGAVRVLNTAMAGSSSEAWLLGGAMFEQGVCLKPSVERAARLYLRAAESGRGDARARLAGLYASPSAGPDKGATLWWAHQAALPMPPDCQVTAEARADADRFAQAVAAWPAARLNACVYAAGVLAALAAEFELAPDEQPKDAVALDFQPAAGKVVVSHAAIGQLGNDRRAQLSGSGLQLQGYANDLSPDQLRTMQTAAGKTELAGRVDAVAQAALARYPKPATVDAGWRIRLRVDGPRLN
jgi:hypothetical protein